MALQQFHNAYAKQKRIPMVRMDSGVAECVETPVERVGKVDAISEYLVSAFLHMKVKHAYSAARSKARHA